MRGSGRGSTGYTPQRRQKKNNEKMVIVLIALVFVLVLAVGGLATHLILRRLVVEPNMEVVSFRDHMGLSSDTYIMIGDSIIADYHVIVIGDEPHLSVDFLMSERLNIPGPHLWWDSEHELLTLTTQTELIRLGLLAETMEYNRQTVPASFSYVMNNAVPYLPVSFISQRFDMDATLSSDNFLLVSLVGVGETSFRVRVAPTEGEEVSTAQLRHAPDIQSYVAQNLLHGEQVTLMPAIPDADGVDQTPQIAGSDWDSDGFVRVRSASGAIGFLHTDFIDPMSIADRPSGSRQPELLPRNTLGVPLHIAWDLVTTTGANYTADRRTVHPGVNVMAPKWLRFAGTGHSPSELSSTIENISSRDYVQWAHNNGMQVWPLLFDYQDPRVASEILSQPHLRDHLIDQLMVFAQRYGFDGIMMDIEGTNASNHHYYLQFLRELAPIMREHNLVYSMAAFVPAPWRLWYDHAEIGRVVDYLAVMAYDQNVASVANLLDDATAGPNASIGFVTQSVRDLVAVMDSEQVILGLPFYSRIWYITDYNDSALRRYRDRSVGIQFGQSYFAGHDWQWSDYYGSYFVNTEGLVDGVQTTTRAWLETERSLELKANLLHQYNLGGVAGWQRMLASPATWTMLQETVQAPRLR